MKKILLTVFTALFAYAAATAQLAGIVVESANDGSIGSCAVGSQPAGTTTYRIYAELQDPTDFFIGVSANVGAVDGVPFSCHPLDISTTTSFFNSPAGSTIGDNINAVVFCAFVPDLGHDTWVTIGNEDNTGTGTNSNWTDPADPLAGPCNLTGENLTAEDGAYFALPGAANGFGVGPNNRVLLGQFTTDGDFSFNLNVSVLDEGVGGTNLFYAWNNNAGCVNLLNYQDVTGLGLTFPVVANPGCTDATACNFDATATEDDGSCTFADPGFDCNGDCLAGVPLVIDILADEYPGENAWTLTENEIEIASGDGTTQNVTICADPLNCYEFVMTDTFGDGQFGSDFGGVDGVTTITLDGVEVFTSTGDWGDEISGLFGDCPIPGCTDAAALNFDPAANQDDGSCVTPGCVDAPVAASYCYDTGVATFTYEETSPGSGVVLEFTQGSFESCCDGMIIYDGADNAATELFNGTGDVTGLLVASTGAAITIEISGDISVDCTSGSQDALNYNVYCGTIFGCTDNTAVNFDPTALTDDGSCEFGVPGCTDNTACNFDPAATANDGSCEFTSCAGCTDAAALNFDATATIDDGSCAIPGCVDAPINNVYCYDTGSVSFTYSETSPGAGVIISINSGTWETCCDALIIYDGADNSAPVLYDGSGVFDVSGVIAASTGADITIEFNGDGSIDCASGSRDATDYDVYCGTIFGCTDATASNFDASALTDDGSCEFNGCTNAAAINFDPAATTDDGSCIVPGCGDAPVNLSYCYTNSDASSFVFTEATPGSGVIIVFNAGSFEVGFDDITVYDGADNAAPSLGTFDGDVSGLVFQSSGASLTIEVSSDTSVSCDSGSETSLDYDVYCADITPGCTDATACNFDAAATVNDGSCEFTSCAGCTDVAAVNYDPTATIDDGSCVFSTLNDVPALASPLSLNVATGPGAGCNGISGEDISAATVVAPEGQYRQTNPDLWYSFIPFSSGNRIQVVTSDFDALIEVFDENMQIVTSSQGDTFEDDNFTDGDEIFHVGDLTAGSQYYIRVAPYFAVAGPALFDICVQTLRDTRCDYGPGPYSLCGTFKADWVFADSYIFNFTSQTTALTYSSDPQASTFLTLSNVQDMPDGDIYDVAIEAVYNLTDGDGNAEQIVVSNDEPCVVELSETPLIQLRASDNSTNFGPQLPGAYIKANSFVCGASAYTWRFERTDTPLLPVEFTTATASTFVRISDALGVAVANDGGVYDVQVKPEFANGSATSYGAVEEITIIGVAGVQGDVIVANDMTEDALRAEEAVVSPSAMIYPNPSTGDAVTLNLNDVAADVEVAIVTVTDFVGRTVASQQITISGAQHQEVLNLNNLASGTYLINVTMNGKVLTEKLIISK
jgi:hypothetical protein